ncbi:SAM-dependent methyltransferase [Clostridium tetanomorphum]|uniref:Class I SAM-dependent methyltransferase n=1 Tax=Clostridium tetanomorphum TaxID=1553 RepID=A0A923J1D2_CLOTT|nr:class I SAM-dependent methyltransferase [Clostridium tetanomorphum]KAJ51694.1 methyltransferase type 11 [Clostridium tetanomorphum DSM 665]MBC2399131.1 class I SAM-dependent methyltransferase [Clostridium tetanomorphum]MBP1865943.1 SAM-dependent methyltransferase [Clostridium tetanomorphum]NRS86124.1 SAM-dependent methyltransferase [Clostridium tetanomorphum]NRZ95855.1 SAM-dependent methyltransferase [Clostridium tetanomorphum]
MKENKYDDINFFNQYKQMARSVIGLNAAGEWHELQKILPNFNGKRVLDLGCGFGWHCRYAIEQGAKSVTGIDISEKMLKKAQEMTTSSLIEYIKSPIEDINYSPNTFDVVISSLAFHYIESFDDICQKVNTCLSTDGEFVFSVEHPVFTAYGSQDWHYDEQGNRLHWPVDQYFTEGIRKANFLGEEVIKYHKTLTTYINSLIMSGFEITNLIEPKPEESMLKDNPEMQDELRRPMMLLISAKKK